MVKYRCSVLIEFISDSTKYVLMLFFCFLVIPIRTFSEFSPIEIPTSVNHCCNPEVRTRMW